MIPHSAPTLSQAEHEAIGRVLRSGRLAQGQEVEAFEQECAAFLRRRYGVAVNSGTAALHLALGALGIARDEPVAIPSYACASLITAINLQGAHPELCDVGEDLNLDPGAVPAHCRVAILAHLFGAPARVPNSALVIEDIAQSMGGITGRATAVAVTSFYATKLITTGEGGMLFTDDEAIAEYARDRRDYDNRDDFIVRNNYKMTDIQAAMGRVQLKRLPGFIARRREIALRYQESFSALPLGLPNPHEHVFFRYVVTTARREALERHLQTNGVDAKRPVYRPAHHYLGGTFLNAERAHLECVSLPIYPSLLDADAGRVIDSVRSFFGA